MLMTTRARCLCGSMLAEESECWKRIETSLALEQIAHPYIMPCVLVLIWRCRHAARMRRSSS